MDVLPKKTALANIPGSAICRMEGQVDRAVRNNRVEHAAGQRGARATSNADRGSAAPETTIGSTAERPGEAPWDGVVSAFVLGWHVAELFHADVPRSARPRKARFDKLPGVGDLDKLSRARLLLAQVEVDLHRIWRFHDADGAPPDLDPIRSLLQADARQSGQLREAVLRFHLALLMALTAADFRLGKAYGLGRALAETVRLPEADDPASFRRAFAPHRLATLQGWLADLKSAFPPHAAEATRGSLEGWAAWAEAPTLRLAIDGKPSSDGQTDWQTSRAGRRPRSGPLPRPPWPASWLARQSPRPQVRQVDWGSAQDRQRITRALHRQGQLWRAILSGEKDCLDYLATEDYVQVADQLLGRIRHLTLRFIRRFWITTTLVTLILAGAIITVLRVHAASTVVAAVVAGAGVIGVTWKGAAASLGRVLAQAQRPLWESELDVALARAVTWTPLEWRSAAQPADQDETDAPPQGAPTPITEPDQLQS
jgi:hypothetical protein